HKSFGQFITGKLIDSFIVGALYIVVMSILGMPYATLAGVIMGVTSIIPFFGPFIGAVPCTLLMLLADPLQCLWFLILMIIIQQIDGNILAPKIIGDSTGLSSFWVIFGMLIGQGIFGFAGLVIGIPLFAVLYSFTKRRIAAGLEEKNLPSDSNDYRDIHHIDDETGVPVMFPHPPYMKKTTAKEKKSIADFFKRKKSK
ncbi:MAG: AI-2E family transporter, partial [Ruminiclostridium sp.]|nr:AI-2E family transporter [Ruminiclostridium sp.]